MEKLLEVLKSIRDDVDFANEKQLVDGGILDSFDIVAIVGELCEEFDVTFTAEDIEPENFNTVEAMMALIERLQDEF